MPDVWCTYCSAEHLVRQSGGDEMVREKLYSFFRRKLKVVFFTFMIYVALC